MPWARAFVLPIAAVVMLVGAGFVLWRLAEQPADQLAGGVESLLFEHALRPVLPGDAKDWPTVALSPDGRLAIDQSRGLRGLRVWDTTTGRIVRRLPDLQVDAVIFDGPDRFTTCNLTGTVRHWNVRDGRRSNAGNDDDGRVDEALSRRGPRDDEAGTCNMGRGVVVWADIDNQAMEIRSTRSTMMKMTQVADGRTDRLAVSPNGHWLFSGPAGGAPGEAVIFASADRSQPPSGLSRLKIDGPMAWAGDTLGAVLGGRNGDASLKLWDIGRGGFFELPLDGLRNPSSLALSADARYALVGTYGGELVLWDVERRRELVRRVAGQLAIGPLWISDDAGTAIGGVGDRDQTLWHAWQPPQVRTALPAVAVAASADGRRAAFAATNGQIEITDAAASSSAAPPPRLQGPQRPMRLAFSADGQRFAAAGESGGVTIWPTPVGSAGAAAGVSVRTDAPLVHLAYTGDGQRLVGVSRIGSIYEWRAADAAAIGVAPGSPGRPVAAVAMRDDGLLAISAPAETGGGRQPVVVRTRDAVRTQLTASPAWREMKLHFIADGQRLAVSERVGSGEWDLRTGAYTAHAAAPATRSTGMEALRDDGIDGSGQWRATVTPQGALQVWKLRGGEDVKLPDVDRPVQHARWTHAGTLVVASKSGAVSVWDPATGRSTAIPVNLGAAPVQLALSADGSRLVATPFSETVVAPAAESNAVSNDIAANDAPPPAAQQQQQQQQAQQQTEPANPPRKQSKQPPTKSSAPAAQSNAPTETNAPLPTVSPAAPPASSPPAAAPAGPLPQAGLWALFADDPPPAPRRLLDERIQWPVASALLLIGLLLPLLVFWRGRRQAQRLRERLQPLTAVASAVATSPPAAAAAPAG
jgi:WD40 repeat protein